MFLKCLVNMSKAQTQFISPAEHNLSPEGVSPSHTPLRKKDGPTSGTFPDYLYMKNVSSASQHAAGTTATSP